MSRFRLSFLLSVLFITSQFITLSWADVVSLEANYVEGEADVVGHLNRDRNALVDGINNIRGASTGGVQSSGQIKADTVAEENMADDANPRIRTYEGAACEFVYTGLLPSTTSGTLIGSIPSGTAYPVGYRVVKSSSTAFTATASKWGFIDLDKNGNFSIQYVSIGSAAPSVTSDAIRIARISTDTTQILSVVDLRKTSCADGPFSAIADSQGEATLSDLLSRGQWVRRFSPAGRTPEGFAEGMFISYDTATTFKVTKGSGYILGHYRTSVSDITVPQTADDPANGISGYDAGGTIPTSSTLYVYAIADQSSVSTYSVTYSTSPTAPSGVTNYRLIGSIKTDPTSLFTSRDPVTVHGINERELIGAWVTYTEVGTTQIRDSFNISSLTDDATGVTTLTIDADFNNASYDVTGMVGPVRGYAHIGSDPRPGTIQIVTTDNNGATSLDHAFVNVKMNGDTRR